MQIYFTGRLLDTNALMAEQAPINTQRLLLSTAGAIGAAIAPTDPCVTAPTEPCVATPTDPCFFTPGDPCLDIPTDPCAFQPGDPCIDGALINHDLATLNPQPLPPAELPLNLGLLASLPASRFEALALNPQPLPPQEQRLYGGGNVIGGSLASAAAKWHGGLEMVRHDLMLEIARPAADVFGGSTAREEESLKNLVGNDVGSIVSVARDEVSLKNLINDDVAHGGKRLTRDRVMPYSPSDYIGGIGSYPIAADRTRAPLFVKGADDVDEVSINDIKQQNIGDCFFLASLAAVARHDPQRIRDMVEDHGNGTYTVTFKERVAYTNPPEYSDKPITVTGDWPGGLKGNGHAAGADVTKQGTVEIWPLVFEKAFGQYLSTPNPYGTLDVVGTFEMGALAMEMITGRQVKTDGEMDLSQIGVGKPIYLGPPAKDFDEFLADFQAGKAITVATGKYVGDSMQPSHGYAVNNVYRDSNGKAWVELYNPWGKEHPSPVAFDEIKHMKMCTS